MQQWGPLEKGLEILVAMTKSACQSAVSLFIKSAVSGTLSQGLSDRGDEMNCTRHSESSRNTFICSKHADFPPPCSGHGET